MASKRKSWLKHELYDDDIFKIIAATKALELDSSSDKQQNEIKHGGSKPGKAPNLDRRRELYGSLLHDDYWGPNPVYRMEQFRRRFRLPRALFDNMLESIVIHDDYFRQKADALGKLGLTPHQKIASSLRMLTSGVSAEEQDDKYRLGESTQLEALKRFCLAVCDLYGEQALQRPTANDLNRLLDEGLSAGWPSYIGSLDCMHWAWKNCPSAWKGMFQGKEGVPTVVLEAIADHSCRFWHFFFGSPGTLNDINILERSPLYNDALNGIAPGVQFEINGNEYRIPYWLVDSIYPSHACFVNTISGAETRKTKLFASKQEGKRKDIERAFGILQARFHILTMPCKLWDRNAMAMVIKTCVILHNLIIDYEKEHGLDSNYIQDEEYVPRHPFVFIVLTKEERANMSDVDRRRILQDLESKDMHDHLKRDLMEHIWNEYANATE